MRDDSGAAAVIGAIIVLAVLGTAVLFVNGVQVPRQGATLEVAGAEATQRALVTLAGALSQRESGPRAFDVPLAPPVAQPPLLAGVVLSPARAQGSLAFDPDAARVRVSLVLPLPSGGVDPADPVRVDEGGGLMRVYLLGNRTSGVPVGALEAQVGGAYLDVAARRVEAGAVLQTGGGTSALVEPPSLRVGGSTDGDVPLTTVSWTIPLLGGASAQVSGAPSAVVRLDAGPLAASGGGVRAHEVQIEVETGARLGWTQALEEAVGARGVVSAVPAGTDAGTVTATILPPAGTPAGTRAVTVDLWAVRFDVQVGQRAG